MGCSWLAEDIQDTISPYAVIPQPAPLGGPAALGWSQWLAAKCGISALKHVPKPQGVYACHVLLGLQCSQGPGTICGMLQLG